MKLTCVIIDDEPLARKILENYVSRLSTVELLSTFDNAVDASMFLTEHKPDFIFLDIRMPEMSGLEMLKILQDLPKVIITSAYSEYGVESYEYDVVDYLLKPIPFDRFMKAINKLMDSFTPAHEDDLPVIQHIILKEGKKDFEIKTNDIVYIQAYGNYLKIFEQNKQHLSRMKITDMEALLPSSHFIRIHKSYLVSLLYLSHLEGNDVVLKTGISIPVSKFYKRSVLERLG